MLRVLSRLCSENGMASIYTNSSDTNSFHFGYILCVNEREIAIHMISPDGEDDGIMTMDVDNVFRVEEKGQYLNKMEKLCSTNIISTYDIKPIDGEIKKAVMMFARDKKLILSMELLNSGYHDIVGFIQEMDDTECKIQQVDEYGFADGYSYISVDDITNVTVLSQDEKRIQKLWEVNQ